MSAVMARINTRQPAGEVRKSVEALARQGDPSFARFGAEILAAFGSPDAVRSVLHTVYDEPGAHPSLKWEVIPFLAAWSGDTDLVLRVWRDELTVNTMRTVYMWGPAFSEARARPEFKQLARDIGFVDYWRESRWADTCRPLVGDDFKCE